jgi:hypothetical protein
LREAKIEPLGNYPAQQRPDYGQVVDSLKAFVTQKGKYKQNHFFIAKVTKERVTNILGEISINDYTYSYWVENDAIIILSYPLADYDWLERKCYIDLRKQVIPKAKYPGSLGGCLVEADWARKIVRKCKAGERLTLKKAT